MKKILARITAFGVGLAVMGMMIVPHLSFAQDYVVSPAYVGTASLSTAQANQICMSLPDATASQMSFCSWTGVTAVPAPIADQAILINVTSPTSAIITWQTNVPTTTEIWYSDSIANVGSAATSINAADGTTTNHTITVSGVNLTDQHAFKVGGYTSSGVLVSSGEELL